MPKGVEPLDIRPRHLTRSVQHALTTDRVVALMGARQAGKTTLVRYLLQSEREPRYYNLKDAAIRRQLAAQARADFRHDADRLIILDEIQQSPDLLGLVQVVVDERPRVQGQFLLLGSNHLLLNRQIKESLAGRVALRCGRSRAARHRHDRRLPSGAAPAAAGPFSVPSSWMLSAAGRPCSAASSSGRSSAGSTSKPWSAAGS